PPPGRVGPGGDRRRGRDRRAADLDDPRGRPDPRGRGRCDGRPRHARGAPRHVPDVRRDRRVAGRSGGVVSDFDDELSDLDAANARERGSARAPITGPRTPFRGGFGVPAEKSEDFRGSVFRLWLRLRVEGLRIGLVITLAVMSVALLVT